MSVSRLLFLIILLISYLFGNAQYYQFKGYGLESGLTDPFIYSITQDARGYLIVGTGEGLGVFDGVSFEMKYIADNLAEDFVSHLYKGKTGIVWIGHKEGGVSFLHGDEISQYDVDFEINSLITGIAEDEKGMIWFSSQHGGVFHIDIKSGVQRIFLDQFDGKTVNDIAISDDNDLFIATSNGVEHYYLSDSQDELFFSKRYLENQNIQSLESVGREGIAIGTNQNGVFILKKGEAIPARLDLPEDILVKNLCTDDENNLYVSTFNLGIYKVGQGGSVHYSEQNGLATPNIQTTFIDREGTMWVGSYGNGIYKHSREVFTYYLLSSDIPVQDILVAEKEMFIATKNKIIRVNNDDFNNVDTIVVANSSNITCLYLDKKEHLWIGTSSKGLFVCDLATGDVNKWSLTSDYLASTINDISGDGNQVWVGTYNGLYEIGELNALIHYDISSGLSHNRVNCLYFDEEDKTLYIGTESTALSMLKGGHLSSKRYSESFSLLNIFHIDKLSDGGIYLASQGDGVFRFLNGKFEQFSTNEGLASNFCYGIVEDSRKMLWVTHNGYLSRIDIETTDIKVFEREDGANKAYLKSAIARQENDIWYGSQDGLLKYNGSNDVVNLVTPVIGITEITVNGDPIDLVDEISLSAGTYDFNVILRGLSLKHPKDVQFSYILENYDNDWSEISPIPEIKFNKLADGEYFLKVKAYNDDLQGSDELIVLKIVIAKPYWKRWWFWLSIFLFLVISIYWYVKFRERRYKIRQEELEKELAIRSKEVLFQKEKLESTNKDITDSINYAKRIQDAVLPDESEFKHLFPRSFVSYRPRDIVSGDFYWVNKRGDEIMLVCGDCTGHGVPGAFLSIIGQQLLREIFDIKNITQPNEIITQLDKSIGYMMNKEQEDFETKDGMDVVVCSFNFREGRLRWASAVRPLIMYRNGKRSFYRGNRRSVGGEHSDKSYDLHELDIEKGDVFYLFSDGYPDQFGGPEKKKLKITGLFDILEEVNGLGIDEQEDIINCRIIKWQAQYPQTDDILFMAVQV